MCVTCIIILSLNEGQQGSRHSRAGGSGRKSLNVVSVFVLEHLDSISLSEESSPRRDCPPALGCASLARISGCCSKGTHYPSKRGLGHDDKQIERVPQQQVHEGSDRPLHRTCDRHNEDEGSQAGEYDLLVIFWVNEVFKQGGAKLLVTVNNVRLC